MSRGRRVDIAPNGKVARPKDGVDESSSVTLADRFSGREVGADILSFLGNSLPINPIQQFRIA